VPQGCGKARRRDEDVDQQIVEVFEEAFEQTFLGRLGQTVGADGIVPLDRFGGAQALGRAVQCLEHFGAGQRVRLLNGVG
jgi:hypothetical protein